MIDWVKATIPLSHFKEINNGIVMSFDRNGVIDWKVGKLLKINGSHDSSISVRTIPSTRIGTGEFTQLEIDGNPAKFLQGHNLWGSDNLIGLVAETLNIPIDQRDWKNIIEGNYKLNRVDSTRMIELNNQANVQDFLYSAERTVRMNFRGNVEMTDGTLYFGKHSRRESLKMYSKATEIKAKGHELPKAIQSPEIDSWVAGKLRVEVCTRRMSLKYRRLGLAMDWDKNTVNENINRLLGEIEVSENEIDSELLYSLPYRLKGTYTLWKSGQDMRVNCKQATFKRHRTELKKYGIDIAVRQSGKEEKPLNVIDFRRVLTPISCEQIPSWAIGTPLYFEPRDFKNQPFLKLV